jgi:hypothetical protein
VLGVEVARFGDDEAGICPRKGRDARTCRGTSTATSTRCSWPRTCRRRNITAADAVFVDGGGVGGGVVDRCRQLRLNVFDIQFGGKADRAQLPGTETAVYANKAPRCGGTMRDWLKVGAIPDDPILKAQLTSAALRLRAARWPRRDRARAEGRDEEARPRIARPRRHARAHLRLPGAAEPGGRPRAVWKTDNVRSAYESARKRLERLGYSFKLWESSGAIWIVRMS